ncbi:MAG: leucine dehydrogenase [Gemmatimonadetes bacterium]|nr:Glu/Leu/Phe/Val dehydrogenase [Gemmatimonadota bacterium]NIQ52203.1 Glu/Leu/Phe/Val dehydrogenase [Gemmatimonadota bacterium]NIU72307.1 leucine dehydrogenase [Gammaproteobacteria bacterium]NIX42804.1 leucine dehydrogenase [Gemmatimonadota bacterium]NIY06969.1 leucine dehydrogenase [Gemmatimonadota bacterium]
MEIFQKIQEHEHEQVVFCHEPAAGYRGIIAIHNSTLGPALGGTRFWSYQNDEDALTDVLRLSRGMTYKAAVAGLNLGGGKAVIIGDPKVKRREMIFRAHGRFVESLKGRYITAEDVGTSVEDMDYVHMETEYVTGLAGRSGDPSPVTAYGTFWGIKAAAKARYGSDDLRGKTVAVQGVGHVGYYLCEDLHAEGARLIVTDIDGDRVQRVVDDFGAEAVDADAIYGVEAEIFAPCALGAVVNDDTLPRFKFDIIAGAANNQLAEERHGQELKDRGILYAPDYVINAGGLINVYGELNGWTPERSKRKAGEIYDTLEQLFELAEEHGLPTSEAADRVAERRIEQVGAIQHTWL